jgi:hypothetical protein
MTNSINAEGKKYLFIEDSTIDELSNTCKVLNSPIKYAGNPILRPSQPWEYNVGFLGTVLKDDTSGLIKTWYQNWIDDNYRVGYATSLNGVHWEKPDCGIYEVKNKPTNQVMASGCTPNVIYEPSDPDQSKRYKMLFWDYDMWQTQSTASGSVAFSNDGIHWNQYADNPILHHTGDTHSLFGWDPSYKSYVAYIRPGGPKDRTKYTRVIGRSTSKNFIDWTEPIPVLEPSASEPYIEYYAMPVFKYENLYLGLLWVFHVNKEEPKPRRTGTMDVQLTVSKDGINWDKIDSDHAFIPLGNPGTYDQGMLATTNGPIQMGNELWFYYTSTDGDHGSKFRNSRGSLAKMRLDGFVSINANQQLGYITTNTILCPGGDLYMNAKTDNGTIAVVVLNEFGNEIDGTRIYDSAIFDSDSIEHKVTWRNHVNLNHLKGKNIRLKFYLKSADLYSFTIKTD